MRDRHSILTYQLWQVFFVPAISYRQSNQRPVTNGEMPPDDACWSYSGIEGRTPLMLEPSTLEFRPIALRVLEERYLRRDPDGRVMETPEELFLRVARGVAAAEERYGGD